MKSWKSVFTIIGSVLVISLVTVANAWAFSMVNVDGVWITVDTDGAANDAWATGPAGGSTTYDTPTAKSSETADVQGALGGNDWNQVRYGNVPIGCTVCGFGGQSGFGFDGVNDVNEGDDKVLAENEVFLIGKWCHFNNPIYAASNDLEYVNLDVQIDDLRCPDGTEPKKEVANPDDTMNVTYTFALDETTNTGLNAQPYCGNETIGWPYNGTYETYQCPYTVGTDPLCPWDGGVNGNGCADEVTIGAVTDNERFICTYDCGAETDYTILILGFVPVDSLSQCPSTVTEGQAALTTYISREAQDSCACLYGRVNEATGTAVELASFNAEVAGEAVLVSWVTVSELDNLGFNLYRETEGTSGWTRLNDKLIPTLVIPGSTLGAAYSFTDSDITAGAVYNYWLMDVDLDGAAKLHGPIEVVIP